MKYIKDLCKYGMFKIKLHIIKRKIGECNVLLSFPIIMRLELEEDWVFRRYKQGRSIQSSVNIWVQKLKRNMNRQYNLPLYQRYLRLKDRQTIREEVLEHFGEEI